MPPIVLCVEQQPTAPLARLGPLLAQAGVEVRVAPAPDGLDDDDLEQHSGVVVLGGEMGCHDAAEFPWLTDEFALIQKAHEQRVPVLGICLGGQLVAQALGGRVLAGACHEIGWFEAELLMDDRLLGPRAVAEQFLWHSDAFELPPGAEALVSGRIPGRAPLAFRSGTSYGFQFHPEVTPELVAGWVASDDGELAELGVNGSDLVAATALHDRQYERQARRIAEGFAALIAARRH
ncbi:MAG TPA: type 1 glutamine amidotransferase [Actinomycetota bacterium]|nr:type 1 glutamine amidotransferase [Actinomycetota bacterium]